MRFFTLDEILELHQLNIERFSGSLGIREQGALESAVNALVNSEDYEHVDAIMCAATYGFHYSTERLQRYQVLPFIKATSSDVA